VRVWTLSNTNEASRYILSNNEGRTALECSRIETNNIARAERKERIKAGSVARVGGPGAHVINSPSWTPTKRTAVT
jgi:hypothetical protein